MKDLPKYEMDEKERMEALEAHEMKLVENGTKRKGWHIDGCWLDFHSPVTFEEAKESLSVMKGLMDQWKENENEK